MWMYIDNARYSKAAVGIALSDSPTGPFRYLHSKNPHGLDSRDMTVFKDEDDTAYLFYASRHSKDMHISQLTQDYLDVTNVSKVLVGRHNWQTIGSPCVGGNEGFRGATFLAQGTFVLPVLGFFVFMADRWKPEDLRDSRYVWLPLTVNEEEAYPKLSISWHTRWRIPSKKI